MTERRIKITEKEALEFHSKHRAGKIEIVPIEQKRLNTQRDLSLAYSPGVAYPCLEIEKDPTTAYDYTIKGNLVAVISNGTAVLGLGNLGALASKPVMEGKAVLFKKFADIDSYDIEVNTEDPDEFVNCIKLLAPTWGGINLEDIKAPECFIIEKKLRELVDIPVFHDDQHGTAIISAAALINAAHLTGRDFNKMKMVVNGAGAAAIACIELIISMGLPKENVILCDTRGVIYQGRTDGMNQWKSAHAAETECRTLEQAMVGADVFLGLSVKGAVTQDMISSMAPKPIIFAMANPDPEITPEEVTAVRSDAIVATGRSDYNNQVNNVMGFPYIFRGALDVRASTINEEMKKAAAHALAMLAREDVPEEVSRAYAGRRMKYGPDYIIPVPFDSRLIITIPPAVAQAAMDSGVAKKPITDISAYKRQLHSRIDPTVNSLNLLYEKVSKNPKTVIFTEGEEEQIIRAALAWRNNGYGKPILVGREAKIMETLSQLGIKDNLEGIEIANSVNNMKVGQYIDFIYGKTQRKGLIYRDCIRLVKNDRNVFAACMLASGDADAMVTGITRSYMTSLEEVMKVIEPKPESMLFSYSVLLSNNRTVFIADTTINELPEAEEMVQIAIQTAHKARAMGHEPRVAFLSFSNFGNPMGEKAKRVRDAVAIMDKLKLDFEYEGEMSADVAMDTELMKFYPFCRLTGPANILIMPGLHSANISAKLLQQLGGGTLIGPILTGLEKSVQIIQMGSTVSDILNLAAVAASEVIDEENKNF